MLSVFAKRPEINGAKTSVILSAALDQRLTELALTTSHSKEDIIKRAIVLFEVAHEAHSKSQRIGIMDADQNLLSEIVGL